MIGVVQTDSEELLRPHRGSQLDLGQRAPAKTGLDHLRRLVEEVAAQSQELCHRGRQLWIRHCEIHDFVADDHACIYVTVAKKRCEPHGSSYVDVRSRRATGAAPSDAVVGSLR